MTSAYHLHEGPRQFYPELGCDWIILSDAGGNVPPLTDFALAAKALRDMLMAAWKGPIPEVISGHTADGNPSQRPHMAILPLSFVGPKLADGRLMGLAVALPSSEVSDEPDQHEVIKVGILESLERSDASAIEVRLGSRGVWMVELRAAPYGLSLDPARYTKESSVWATVTPIVLNKFPKAGLSTEAILADACAHIGLPRPSETDVRVVRTSAIAGSPPARSGNRQWGDGGWSLPARRDGSRHPFEDRLSTHAVIRFTEQVSGPVVLGAGRFLGLGLCMPIEDAEAQR